MQKCYNPRTVLAEFRYRVRWPLTDRQKDDKRVVSVMIPCVQEDYQYLKRTIDSLWSNASGPIEIIVAFDGFVPDTTPVDIRHVSFVPMVGQRVAMNQMVDMAEGEFILRIDAHCAISQDWDARMKDSCGPNTIIAADGDCLRDMEKWRGDGSDGGMWAFMDNIGLKKCYNWKNPGKRYLEEPMMTTMGQGYMIRKDYYCAKGGCDEDLGSYGDMGVEWALKTWLTDGKIVMRTDVVISHLFRPNAKAPFKIDNDMRLKASNKLYKEWILGKGQDVKKPFWWLLNKFNYYAKWSKDAKLRLQMHLLSPHVRENYFVDENAQDEVSSVPGQDGVSSVESNG